MKTTLNAHEHVARIRKVDAIVRVLTDHAVNAHEARRYTPDEQAIVARMAEVNAPSPKSWAAVVERLDELGAPVEGVCGFCATDGCDDVESGAPCHRLCAEEDDYRRAQDRRLEEEMSL